MNLAGPKKGSSKAIVGESNYFFMTKSVYAKCKQRKCRSACTSMQSDQCIF